MVKKLRLGNIKIKKIKKNVKTQKHENSQYEKMEKPNFNMIKTQKCEDGQKANMWKWSKRKNMKNQNAY